MERISKWTSILVSQIELNNLLEIFSNFNEQIDMIRMKNKQKVENVSSFIFFPKCRKKHALHECPLDNIKICEIYATSHTTKDFPSLLGLKAVYQWENQSLEQSCYVAPRRPWQPHQPSMVQDLISQFQGYAQ